MQSTPSTRHIVIAAALGIAALLGAGTAQARNDVSVSIGIHLPGASIYAGPGYGAPPVHVRPRPIYVQPAPIYLPPPPVFVTPRPIYLQPAPVYVYPRPIYVQPPAYGYYRPGPGWKRGHWKHGHGPRDQGDRHGDRWD